MSSTVQTTANGKSDAGRDGAERKTQDVVRLSVNLAVDVAQVLKNLAAAKNISVTEAIRRAIAVLDFIEGETAKGNKIAVVEKADGKDRVREVVLL